MLFTLSAFIISSMGLNFILNMALPVLEVLAPIAIILVIIGLILKPKKLSAETGK